MAGVVTVTYEDGHQDSVRLLPLGLVAAERHFKTGDLPAIEGTLYAAWSILKPGPNFDDWVASLTDLVETSEETVPPTPQDPPPAP